MRTLLAVAALLTAAGCAADPKTFGRDVEFLRRHLKDVVVLSDRAGHAQVAVCPKLQGRVMTSTLRGDWGRSHGWINYELIASGKTQPHINAFGGEDRFWLGPEGGQYSIFFAAGAPFDLEHWYTPAPIDTESFTVAKRGEDWIAFRKKMRLVNYSGTVFDVDLLREIRLLSASDAWKNLGIAPVAGVEMVAYESDNRITNAGEQAWVREKGLLSVWILGMFVPSDSTTVVIPFKPGAEADLGPVVNDAYFGKVPADRLAVKERVLFFKGDGQRRSKIGVSPRRARPFLGSFDAERGLLTIVQYTLPEGATDYVNSMWQLQKDPYAGDAVNSYNDGPATPGAKPFGPFYELESSSPAAALAPGATLAHVHRTFHFEGPEEELDSISRRLLGAGLDAIRGALQRAE